MQINKAAMRIGELPHLRSYLDNILDTENRQTYIKWLAKQGDETRASFLADLCRSFEHWGKFHYLNSQGVPKFWTDIIGMPQLSALRASSSTLSPTEISEIRDHIFKWARPALEFEYSMMGEEPLIGSSYFWGTPDLEKSVPWPTLGDCLHWDEIPELDKDLPCAFIGQINLADLKGTLIEDDFPSRGLLSFFAHSETCNWGVISVKVIYTKNTQNLERRLPPAPIPKNHDNMAFPPHKIYAREILTFPETHDSPWEEEFPHTGYSGKYYDSYEAMRTANKSGIVGMMGYPQATSGGDPSPDQNHVRFINIRVTPDAACLHLAISKDDLKAGKLEKIQYVWIDFDG
ncbi:MAG: DUF1963 domain-containing protein [Robiginitomaculum sp.]|nr:DUF1963 domain-containing protein [Robiginitomaculum sp.]